MATGKKFTWLVSPKSFIQLIGTEYDILRKSGSSALVRFYSAAVIIVVILIISCLSIFYAMDLLFHNYVLELIFSIFISMLFVFIYIFLLNTFSKPIFRKAGTAEAPRQMISVSNIIRTGFVVFMAFLVSKPLEVLFFEKPLTGKVRLYREYVVSGYGARLQKMNEKEVGKMEEHIRFYELQLSQNESQVLRDAIADLKTQVNAIRERRLQEIEKVKTRINKSDFLLFRIKQVSKKPLAWLICMGLILLFLLPGFLIYFISTGDAYYELKKKNEVGLVLEEYQAFEKWYSSLFAETYQLQRSYYSKYEDPPLNTRLKSRPVYRPEKDFLDKYCVD